MPVTTYGKKSSAFEEKKPIDISISGTFKVLLIFLFIMGILGIAKAGFFIVNAGERGILMTWGNPEQVPQKEGIHFKMPIAQTVIKMDIKTQKYEASASAASKDLQIVTTNIAVNYHLSAEETPKIYQEIGLSFEDRIIQPRLQEAIKAVTARYTAEELITKRPEVKNFIEEYLSDSLSERGIILEELSITNFDFSTSFNAAIEAKVTAEQEALKAERVLQMIKIEKEQTITRAEAEAQATKNRAEAEAYALRVVREELAKSDKLVKYKAVEKWDGIMPKFTGGGVMPFVDVATIQE